MNMALQQTAFRLDAEDLEILDETMRQTGVRSRTDALRLVLRHYARQHGIAGLEPLKPRPREIAAKAAGISKPARKRKK